IDFQVMALEQPRDRGDRAHAHLVWLDAGGNEPAEDAKRLEALLRRNLVAHDHAGRGAIGELARIAGTDGLALEHRLDLRKTFSGSVRPRTLVLRQRYLLIADLLGILVDRGHFGRDGHDLVIKASA